MLARRWGGIFTAVCMVMHGRRVPVDACGLDPSSGYPASSMTARIRARHPQTKSHGARKSEPWLAQPGCHTLPGADRDIH